jgi:hypothetical protein
MRGVISAHWRDQVPVQSVRSGAVRVVCRRRRVSRSCGERTLWGVVTVLALFF